MSDTCHFTDLSTAVCGCSVCTAARAEHEPAAPVLHGPQGLRAGEPWGDGSGNYKPAEWTQADVDAAEVS